MSRPIDPKEDSLYFVAQHLLRQANIPITDSTLRTTLLNHPNYPSFASLTDVFESWNIETLAARIKLEELKEVEFPAIAHLQNEKGLSYFVVIKSFKNDQVVYFQADKGNIFESLDEFANKWGGAILFMEFQKNSGEKKYLQHYCLELIDNVQKYSLIGFSLLFVIWGLFNVGNWLEASSIVIYLIGVYLSALLLVEQYDFNNSWIKRLCTINEKSSCQSVLESPAAVIFGWLKMSEVGLVYFTGGLLTSVYSIYTGKVYEIFPLLAWINIATLPYTFFSIYYQARTVKKWCPLCVGVQILLWFQFFVMYSYLDNYSLLNASDLTLLIISFLLPTTIWAFFKSFITSSQRVFDMEKNLSHFRDNSELFGLLLEAELTYEMEFSSSDIGIGPLSAPTILTIVSGPFCSPCALAHKDVEYLLNSFPEDLRIVFRFVISKKDPNHDKNKFVKHLMNIAVENPNDIKDALSSWYKIRNYEKWKKRYPIRNEINFENALKKQIQWCENVNIEITPTFFFNNRTLPKQYSLDSLYHHIRMMSKNLQKT